MIVQVPLQLWSLPWKPTVERLNEVLHDYYRSYVFVTVSDAADTSAKASLLDPEELNDTNHLRLFVFAVTGRHMLICFSCGFCLKPGAFPSTISSLVRLLFRYERWCLVVAIQEKKVYILCIYLFIYVCMRQAWEVDEVLCVCVSWCLCARGASPRTALAAMLAAEARLCTLRRTALQPRAAASWSGG